MKNRNFVNLNINPCKMCMPLGAVTAFKGIENSMMILHGSQGCVTYIRRHMAGHYNEPIDIASSSLNEEGTVYGGEANLKKGLRNIIKLYNPEIIGVATTCLAETIGEDIRRMTSEFMQEEALGGIHIVPVSTPGYGGTQFEGYFAALTGIVKTLAKQSAANGKINIIVGSLGPGDVRNIKLMLDAFDIEYILLPDISETLDAPYREKYSKIPAGGTKIDDIQKMAGAAATIELGLTISGSLSPGQYLFEEFHIPLYRCALPIGMKNTDRFLQILSGVSGKNIPLHMKKERGRFVDGMIDSHKYNAEGRAVIYGEPELVYAVTELCLENGITPVLVCTGAKNEIFNELVSKQCSALLEKPVILDDTDFQTIREYARKFNANLLIGNSDGKFITEKEGIPLVRMGFPIHDRVGGQRQMYTGYNGSLKLLDDITNTLLENKYENYRKSMFDKYYQGKEEAEKAEETKKKPSGKTMEQRTQEHPCYSGGACKNARMHIPVAPACNISCNYCSRKYDCMNESRPGVTSQVLTPREAAEKFAAVKHKLGNLKVVGIAGPGDALANFENTRRSIELIKEIDPDITFCLSTNGLMLPHYAKDIAALGVTHVTVTVNAIDPEIAAGIYKEINYMGKKYTGIQGAGILIKNQLDGLASLASMGVICKVNIVMIKGVNDSHIEEVVKKAKECGAFMTNIMPLIPAKGSAFEHMQLTSNKELQEMRKKCEPDLKQMYHCRQCRADAIGTLDQDCAADFREDMGERKNEEQRELKNVRYTFAVASKTGLLVDQHFGHVEKFYIYSYDGSAVRFIEQRAVNKYCTGQEDCGDEDSKIDKIIKTIRDCDAVLVLRIGYNPSKVLQEEGILAIQTWGRIEEAVKNAIDAMEASKELLHSAL